MDAVHAGGSLQARYGEWLQSGSAQQIGRLRLGAVFFLVLQRRRLRAGRAHRAGDVRLERWRVKSWR